MRVSDYLDFAATRYPDAEALVCESERLNYRNVSRTVHAVAHAFTHDHRTSGEQLHIAIYSTNDIWVPLLQLGANRADHVWLGVHVKNSLETNIDVLTYMDCNVVAFGPQFAQDLPRLMREMPKVKLWLALDPDSKVGTPLLSWLEGHWEDFPYSAPDMTGTACILPTGGTTGPSKGAAHSHHSIEMELINLRLAYDIVPGSRLLTVAPLSHAAGQFALGFIPGGGCNVILREFDPTQLLATIGRERITHLFVPPTILYALLVHPDIRATDLTSVTCLIVGAAPVSPDKVKEAVSIFGPVIYEAYAQTETLIPVLAKQPRDYIMDDGTFDDVALRTSGKPPAFVCVEIMGDDGILLGTGQPGEIVVRSSMAMSGYYNLPDATAEASQFGWHHTGDVGIRDDRGFITLVDRKKDMIISGAFNVYPAEVEHVINRHPAVLECIVIGVPDEKWGEAVKALVKLKTNAKITENEIIAHCREYLGGVKTPKTVEFWPELPRSPVGKLLRREARNKYWKGHWRAI